MTIRNSAAHANGNDINFGTTNMADSLTIKNTISLGTNGGLNATSSNQQPLENGYIPIWKFM
jgi:hypothetical protein